MQDFSLGAGLAALAFWGFIAAIVVAGIWYDIRKREAQHETIRRLVESGQPLDETLVDKLLSLSGNRAARPDRDFRITGYIVLPAAAGIAILALALGMQFPEWRLPLLGVSGLVACVGLGFLGAARLAARWRDGNDPARINPL